MINKCISGVLLSSIACLSIASSSTLIPTDGSSYYQIGGGDVTPLPYDSGENIDLDVGGNASLGFNCGAFNPMASITNSLNGVKSSFGGIANDIFKNATGMIIGEGGYVLAKAMPNVYKYMRDGMSFGQNQFSLSTKSCQTMLSQVDNGQNPNNNMMKVAMGQDWKYHMSVADSDAAQVGMLGSAAGDIVQAKAKVDKDAGDQGVQWTQGKESHGQLKAGGVGQPVILLTSDTVTAGYNVLIGKGRSYNDISAPAAGQANAGITQVFSSPVVASKWAEYVIGENSITTYSSGPKKVTPGKGLLHFVYTQTQVIKTELDALVTGKKSLSIKSLHSLDSPRITISPGVIKAIQKIEDPTLQAIWINRIAQGIAVNRVVNKAALLRQLLMVGSQVPSISSNSVAQTNIKADLSRLNMFIGSIRQGAGDSKAFLSSSVEKLLQRTQAQELASVSTQPARESAAVMSNGAILSGGQ